MGAVASRLTVALRADAGPVMGYGHVVRTLALGDALGALGAECIWVTRPPPGGFKLPLPDTRLELSADVPHEMEGKAILQQAGSVDWVVTDLYEPDDAWRAGLRGPWRLVSIDDDEPMEASDLSVCPSLVSAERPYRGMPLVGGRHVLLRSAFANARKNSVRETIQRVLVCLGGSNTTDLGGRIVSYLDKVLPPSVHEVRIVGDIPNEAFGGGSTARCISKGIALTAEGMVEELRLADIAVLAAGTLLYEAAAVGLPAMWVSLNAGQAREAEVAQRLGAGIYLGTSASILPGVLETAFDALCSFESRQRMAHRATDTVDGQGAARVAERMVEMHGARRSEDRRGAPT